MTTKKKGRPRDVSWEDIMAEYQSIRQDTGQMKTWYFFIPMMIKCIVIPIIVIANLVL